MEWKMFKKPVPVMVMILLATVSFIFFKNFRITGLSSLNVEPRASSTSTEKNESGKGLLDTVTKPIVDVAESVTSLRPKIEAKNILSQGQRAIRIATFNLDSLNQTKARKPHVMDVFARVIREFDVVALQEIQSDSDDLLPRLTDLVNRSNGKYDYAIGPRLGPEGMQEQYAFMFDATSVELDRTELYTVDDRDDLMVREPFVGWFRVRGIPKDEAFTFSLVNVHIDPSRRQLELDVLDNIMFAVRQDGRDEDDVILLGDFCAGCRSMGQLSELSDLGYAVREMSTKTDGKEAGDNLVFQKTPTVEFTGRSGVLDFLREFNLSMNQALEISDHLPVWAEFSIFEGGDPGRVARLKAL